MLTDCNYCCKNQSSLSSPFFWSFPCFPNSNLSPRLWENENCQPQNEKGGGRKKKSSVHCLTVESGLTCPVRSCRPEGERARVPNCFYAAETGDRPCLRFTGMWNCVWLKQANHQLRCWWLFWPRATRVYQRRDISDLVGDRWGVKNWIFHFKDWLVWLIWIQHLTVLILL